MYDQIKSININLFIKMKAYSNIDDFIADFPESTQKLLEQMRSTIQKAAPEATETISYGIPTFVLKGNLVHFSGYKNHIGFYPGSAGIKSFEKELSKYKGAKGSVQFPINEPLPLDLVTKIVEFRVIQNLEKAEAKKTLKTCPKGHKFHKTPECPTCPICEQDRKPEEGFLSNFSSPARRALEGKGINSVKKLASFTEKEIMALHGMGPASLPKMKAALKDSNLSFKE